MHLGAFVLRFRVGDILGKSLIEELQVLFVEENLQLGFHREMRCLALKLASI